MKTIFLTWIAFIISLSVHAYEERNLLQKSIDKESLKNTLILNQKWVKYPDYKNRAGWDALTGELKQSIISRGNNALNYEWKVIKATDYLEFDRNGNRDAMQDPYYANIDALSELFIAELAEGKGRFNDQIANGVWLFCEMTSWARSCHMGYHTRLEKSSLPDYNEHIIDLSVGDIGSLFAWINFFLKEDLDKIHPLIAKRMRQSVQDRFLDAYMNRDYGWHAFKATPLTKVNNWNTRVNFNALSAFLLMENDPDKLAAAVYRSMISVDKFINYYHDDGACEEGTSYFSGAVGKLYDYLQMLEYAGLPVSSIFNDPLIKRMGEFISKAYIGNGWVVNYSDASPRFKGPVGVIFRYGEAVGSDEMKQFAAHLYHHEKKDDYIFAGVDIFRNLENISSHGSLVTTHPAVSTEPFMWYPQTELLFIRDKSGFFFSAKGGTNQQSHNHNDIGNFVLFYNNQPVFIDAGVGTYTGQTFGSGRYSIFTMQSDYHNVPVINGISQRSFGSSRRPDDEKYSARDVKFDAKLYSFSVDIVGSYHPDSKAESWKRSYDLNPGGRLTIEDQFVLSEAVKPNQVNFMTSTLPDLSQPGKIRLKIEDQVIVLKYAISQFDASLEVIELTDKGLYNTWGEKLYRLSLNARELANKGKYKFEINRE